MVTTNYYKQGYIYIRIPVYIITRILLQYPYRNNGVIIMVKKQVCFNLEETTIKQVKQLALDNGTTATEIYTNAITEYLQKTK